jgi:serine/threonine protein kinase/tetratricopeptide (TPR) repeat protein
MTGEASLQTLFARALECASPAERDAFLATACGNDAALRRSVEELIAAHARVGGFMSAPAAELAATALLPAIGERPGDQIGPYKLLEQIGEGGMGLVFMAEQTQPLRRRVALKIIKPGLDTRAVIARFEAERQALALMDHPNIAKIFDAGTTGGGGLEQGAVSREQRTGGTSSSVLLAPSSSLPASSGRPYFVMELVRGAPITDYCREQGLNIRQRLELFLDVCHAVQHAHQKGVIHRDLKPSNILVTQHDTAPVPKVIDFGVAKATASQSLTDKTLFTQFSQIIGTPLYMSPEQADLRNQDIDTRSDVYSLGVVLYELLTGATPFDAERLRSAGPDEMRRIIREEEPPKPSTRATTIAAAAAAIQSTVATKPPARPAIDVSALRGDLDWIVMKALEKDRRRRYESPSALAADIQRHLADEPVQACPPSAAYRFQKFARRNRSRVVGVAVALLALVGVAVGLAWNEWRTAQRRQAIQQTIGEIRTAAEAGDLQLAGERFAEIQGVLAGSGLNQDDELTRTIEAVEKELNQRRSDRQRFEDFFRLTNQAQENMAVELTFGREQHALEPLDLYGVRTDPRWTEHLDASTLDQQQRDAVREECYFLLVWLASSTLDWKQFSEGIEYLHLAESFHKPTRAYYAVLSRCHDGLGNSAAAAEAQRKFEHTPAESAADHVQSGFLAQSDGKGDEAIRAFEAALRMQPDNYVALIGLAGRLAATNRPNETIQLLTGCIALRPKSSAAYRLRAEAYRGLGDREAALSDLDTAIRLAKLTSDISEARRIRIELLYDKGDAGRQVTTAAEQEDLRRILASLDIDIEKATAGLGPNHEETLGLLLLKVRAQGRLEPTPASLAGHEQILARITQVFGPDHSLTLQAHRDLAYFLEATGRLGDSVPHWAAQLEIVERTEGPDAANRMWAIDGLARAKQAAGEVEEALTLYEGLLADWKQKGKDPYSFMWNNAAAIYSEAGRHREAAAMWEHALNKAHASSGNMPTTQLVANGLLGCIRSRLNLRRCCRFWTRSSKPRATNWGQTTSKFSSTRTIALTRTSCAAELMMRSKCWRPPCQGSRRR